MRSAPLFAACLAATLAAPLAAAPRESRDERAQRRFQQLIANRTPGKPQSCISLPLNRSSTIVDDRTIVFRESSRLLWVNTIPGGCPGLRADRATITQTPSTRLCRGDILTVIDPPTPIQLGSCAYGDFVPYRR